MLIFDLVSLNTQRLRARRAPDCDAHRRAGQRRRQSPSPPELEVRVRLARRGADTPGSRFVDVRDARERADDPLPSPALNLPMSKLLTDAATLDTARALPARLRHGQAQRRRGRPAALAGISRVPFASWWPQGIESLRLKHALTLVVACLLALAGHRRPRGRRSPPTIPCSISRANCRRTRKPDLRVAPGRARAARRPNMRWPRRRRPPTANARGSIGALRFADLHADLALARTGQGDFAGAAQGVSQRACVPAARPADPRRRSPVSLFDARDYAAAREAIDTALAIAPRARECQSPGRQHRLRRRALGGRHRRASVTWPPAIRTACRPDTVNSCTGWRRCAPAYPSPNSSNARPVKAGRSHCCSTCVASTPKPSSRSRCGEGDDEDNPQPNTSTDERLCEALFYVGEAYWARGQLDVARDYFAALVNIKVIYFLEHGLALAEIAKLRAMRRQPVRSQHRETRVVRRRIWPLPRTTYL